MPKLMAIRESQRWTIGRNGLKVTSDELVMLLAQITLYHYSADIVTCYVTS